MREDLFRFDDAAYVLGALEPAERARFEAHLRGCEECQARVAELAALPAVLSGAGPRAVVLGELVRDRAPLPETVLPALLSRASRERRRRHSLVGAMAAVAAACIAVLVVALWPSSSSPGTPQALTALVATPLQATATLIDRPWGTQVDLDCRYRSGDGVSVAYGLVVLDRAGNAQQLGTWTVAGSSDTRYSSGTSLPRGRIAAIEITYAGRPVLRLDTG